MNAKVSKIVGAKWSLCSRAIEIAGQTLRPDAMTAYVEFELGHAFPVVTADGTALHPQVVQNSYGSMLHKVFNLNHMMRAYNPQANTKDRALGAVVAVEFKAANSEPLRVQGDKEQAPGIRGAAALFKQAEQVEQIIQYYQERKVRWTVSMEDMYFLSDSGFVVQLARSYLEANNTLGAEGALREWVEQTPEDLRTLGYVYVPYNEAPGGLQQCAEEGDDGVKVKNFLGKPTVLLLGGLNGQVQFTGVGLTPLGKEAEAKVNLMLASQLRTADCGLRNGEPGADGLPTMPDYAAVLRKGLRGIYDL